MSALRSSVRSSALVENVLSGTAIAPMRAAASQPTTNAGAVRVEQADVRARGRRRTASSPLRQRSRPRGGIGVRQHVVVADEQRMLAARRARSRNKRGHGERQAVARVDARGAHDVAAAAGRAASRLRSPATASIVAVHSVSPLARTGARAT